MSEINPAPHLRVDDLLHGGLRIIQDPSAPCFSVDAVLLADFARLQPGERVMDLGTGTGILPLLLSQKQADCMLTGLELMPQMAEMAAQSVQLNGLTARITIAQGDIRTCCAQFGKAAFDVVVSNPPYFKAGQGRENGDPLFLAARAEVHCTFAQLVEQAAGLLVPLGRFYMVHRAVRSAELISGMETAGLHVERIRFVQPYAESNANLVLLAAKKGGRGETQVLPPLVIYQSPGQYSKEMEKIYGYDGNAVSGRNADR